jgi:DNA-binding PadR family transcriptional regulator
MERDVILKNFRQEIKKGALVMVVLQVLKKKHYGYALVRTLEEKDFAIDRNTLYPLLRRLEEQNLLTAEWDTSGSRPRKYYMTGPKGKKLLPEMIAIYQDHKKAIDHIIGGE